DVLVFDPLVFSAGALVIAHRAENLLAEKAARLGLERAVIDRLGILDLALRPFANGFRRSDRDRKSTRLNSSHLGISYAVLCVKKKKDAAYNPAREPPANVERLRNVGLGYGVADPVHGLGRADGLSEARPRAWVAERPVVRSGR